MILIINIVMDVYSYDKYKNNFLEVLTEHKKIIEIFLFLKLLKVYFNPNAAGG